MQSCLLKGSDFEVLWLGGDFFNYGKKNDVLTLINQFALPTFLQICFKTLV